MRPEEVKLLLWALVPAAAVLVPLTAAGQVAPVALVLVLCAMAGGCAFALKRRAALERERLVERRLEIRDLGDRVRRGEAKLAAADRIIESLPDPVFLLNAEGRVIRANPAATTLTDAPIAGRFLSDSLRHPELLAAVERAGETHAAQTVELTLPVPVECAYLARVEPVDPGAGEEDAALLISLQDVTTVLRSERMRVDFVANVSHELRTPLTSLVGFIETLRGPARDDAEAHDKFLGIMQDQANRMLRLLQDLLSLSRIEMDEHTRPRGRVVIEEVIGSITDLLAFKARSRGMRFRIDLPGDLPPVLGDEDQLMQVFQNLVENAIKYGDEDTSITIQGERRGDGRLAISVIDKGRGIPRDHLPRLTERFYRVDPARSREMGGTGLGLAIVKHIVNRHRGRLAIDSQEGVGSTFTVTLPLAESTPRSLDAAS